MTVRSRSQALRVVVLLALSSWSCRRRVQVSPTGQDQTSSTTPSNPAAPGLQAPPAQLPEGTIDLLPAFQEGVIDIDGPVIDMGETQARAFVVDPQNLENESINGDSWGTVGNVVRMRVPVSIEHAPTMFRMRLRHINARGAVVLIDGLHARQIALRQSPTPTEVRVSLAPDSFRRPIADVQIRFFGIPRAVTTTAALSDPVSVSPAVRTMVTVNPAAQIDWIHLHHYPPWIPATTPEVPAVRAHHPVAVQRPHTAVYAPISPQLRRPPPLPPPSVLRVVDMVNDVRATGTPRRALTFYPPTVVSVVRVVPAGAVLRAAFSAEGVRGSQTENVSGTIRVEADGTAPLEATESVAPGDAWKEVSLDLSHVAGRAVRIVVSAHGSDRIRLAVADPRIETQPEKSVVPMSAVRHVLMLVLRGVRSDRFLPSVSSRLSAGGFSQVVGAGLLARAVVAAPRALPAFVSVVTGLPWWAHNLNEYTDTLGDEVPTLAQALHDAGVTTAAFVDDHWWEGSGLNKGFNELSGCKPTEPVCAGSAAVLNAGDWLVHQQERRAFALVALGSTYTARLRASKESVDLLDPTPMEGAFRTDDLIGLAARSRLTPSKPIPRVLESEAHRARINLLYDAALYDIDQALHTAIERLRDAGMLRDTMIIVVGDMGAALGEAGLVGDASMSLTPVSHTVMMTMAPGVLPRSITEVLSTLDVAATVRERLGVGPLHWRDEVDVPFTPRSVFDPHEDGVLHPRGVIVPFAANDLGLRFGDLLALSRANSGGQIVLLDPDKDILGQNDMAQLQPNATGYAQVVLSAFRAWMAEQTARRGGVVIPSTRALPDSVAGTLRESFLLRH